MLKILFRQLFSNDVQLTPYLFLARTLIWLPALIILWYLLAPWLLRPALELAQLLFPLGLPNLVESIEIQNYHLKINTYLGANTAAELPVGSAKFYQDYFLNKHSYPFLLSLYANGLIYTYGLPITAALSLASNNTFFKKISSFLLIFLVISLIQLWGLYFYTLRTLITHLSPELTEQANELWTLLRQASIKEFIMISYRLGLLLLPTAVPILVWIQLNKALVFQLTHSHSLNK